MCTCLLKNVLLSRENTFLCKYVDACTYAWQVAVVYDRKIHCVPKKEATKLLVITFSNLNRFSKSFHCWKEDEISNKIVSHFPPHLKYVPALFEECWKSVKIWESYCQKFGGLVFWNTVYNRVTTSLFAVKVFSRRHQRFFSCILWKCLLSIMALSS